PPRPPSTPTHNPALGRHGWLRLTPAYSVKLVREIIGELPDRCNILDPFSGTATTGVAAAELGHSSLLFDINPFLVWLGNAKLANLEADEAIAIRAALAHISAKATELNPDNLWLPPLKNIERWWSEDTLNGLGRLRAAILDEIGEPLESGSYALIWIAFARIVIEHSAAAFNHVSVSFHDDTPAHSLQEIILAFESFAETIVIDASNPLPATGEVVLHDSSTAYADAGDFDALVTSPPYSNRISYIRELRPYMFWLGFLSEAREAGELDWQAIGGTWGIATSRLMTWEPTHDCSMASLAQTVDEIASSNGKNGELLSLYVKKYYCDMDLHIKAARSLLRPGAELHYIIGNSTFYGVHVDTPKLYEESLRAHGFRNVESRIIRKRNSKKELFEYCTSATLGGAKKPKRTQSKDTCNDSPAETQLCFLEERAPCESNGG
ncbi:MAG: DNA adenine methylase, partial [Verrucomicrobiota bacterium]